MALEKQKEKSDILLFRDENRATDLFIDWTDKPKLILPGGIRSYCIPITSRLLKEYIYKCMHLLITSKHTPDCNHCIYA